MAKKRLTQRFPWLVPLRRRQRVFCFYWGMRLDGRRYAAVRSGEELPRRAFEANSPLYNRETGWDMRYQENKVHNLKLAAAMLDGMLIQPGETFSFCRAIRRADHRVPYKDGLTVVDGKLTAAPAAAVPAEQPAVLAFSARAPDGGGTARARNPRFSRSGRRDAFGGWMPPSPRAGWI